MAKKILIVDDNSTIRDLVSFTLQLDGLETISAVDGLDALTQLNKIVPQEVVLIITDIVMPKMDGFALIKQLRKDKNYHKIPVVVLTARGLEEDERTARSVGAAGFIRKPFEPAELLAEVRKMLHTFK
ncbi:MAG: response regulator [bacterium]|nr:response regulator [bacterium]